MLPPGHTLRPICNWNTIKMSPSCLPNMATRISGISKAKLKHKRDVTQDIEVKGCNCTKNPCPLGGACSTQNLVYKAKIINTPQNYFYYGSSAGKFISRYHVHKGSFNHRNSQNKTTLSTKVWELRDAGHQPEVKFSLVKTAPSADTCASQCQLCLCEKKHILYENNPLMLNSRDEIFTRCRHRARWKVKNCI